MPHVTVIDECGTVRKLLQHALAKAGFSVSVANGAAAGLATIRREQPDAVVLSVEMSPLDGIWCLEQIRHDAEILGLPVILMSSRPAREIIVRAEQFKVQGIVFKDHRLVSEVLDRLARLKMHVRREHTRVAAISTAVTRTLAKAPAAWRLDALPHLRTLARFCSKCARDRTGLPSSAPCPECGKLPA